jgi:hypothetical protein
MERKTIVMAIRPLATVTAFLLFFTTLGTVKAYAASANVGDAVYRDGVVYVEWHAAIMDDPDWNTTSKPIIHAPGFNSNVKYGSWSEFLGGNKYTGVYRPKKTPSAAARDNFRYMARKLKDEKIPYTVANQVYYSINSVGTWVDPAEIQSMRCDGVVEYVYEWYGFRVYGGDSYWDVTRAGSLNRELHGGTAIAPRRQAETFLYKVSGSLP